MNLDSPAVCALISFSLVAGLAGAWILRREPGRAHAILIASVFTAILVGSCSMIWAGSASTVHTERTERNPPWQALPGRPLDVTVRDFATTIVESRTASGVDMRTGLSSQLIDKVWLSLSVGLTALLILSRLPGLFASARLYKSARAVDNRRLIESLDQARCELGIVRNVGVRLSDAVSCPVIWCWYRPTVFIPANFLDQSSDQWRLGFLHELSHLNRRDHWWDVLIGFLLCVVPWHPCVWICRLWVRRFSERACDEQVLTAGVAPEQYVQALLHFSCRTRPLFLSPMASRHHETVTRIERILKWDVFTARPIASLRPAVGLLIVACLAAAIPIIKSVAADDDSIALSQDDKADWIQRLSSAPENSSWFVGANLGRELSTLPGRQNAAILTACWDDIADSVRPQVLKGLMPAFKKTDGISDGLFDILDLARNDSSANVRQFATAYLSHLTFSFDVTSKREYSTWRNTHGDQSATDIIVEETKEFVSGLSTLQRDEMAAAIAQLADAANDIREFSAMRQAALDAGLINAMDQWTKKGWVEPRDENLMHLWQNLTTSGVATIEPRPTTSPGEDAEFAGLPVEELVVDRGKRQRYLLMGPAEDQDMPIDGWKLLLILPGGDGSAEFSPFCRRIHKNALPDGYVATQLIAPVWSKNKNRVVWPSRKLNPDKAKFTTEKFIAAVVDDVTKRIKIDDRFVFALGWSSGGPPLYAAALERKTPVTGALIAMSVFKPQLLPTLKRAKGRSFYLLHSPDDFIRIDQHARVAERQLTRAGANVRLQTYGGGHGWREDPFGHIRRGVEWLEEQIDD